ncbi:MAG: ATP-binding protein [Planctomycetota bacterium]|nr:ATP-binding protein [Planctomycetota bacterium]
MTQSAEHAQAPVQPSAEELPELLRMLNDATSRFQVSHDQLTAEVSRLRAQLRDADEQLQRSRRLAGLGEMAAGIAHEIRNPLGSIGLYATMLAEDLEDRPEERDIATKIGRAVRGLDAIVTDVLAFAGEAKMRLLPAPVDELLEAAVELSGAVGGTAGLRVEIEAGPAGLDIECDFGKLRQALVNVIRNGVEAIEEAAAQGCTGQPVLRVSAVLAELPEGEAVVFVVRDSGTGIHGEATERMFNPFYTTRAVGTGLGLAIVHRIVDAHGGRVSVSNNGPRPGDGATVEIIIPRRQGRAARAGNEHGRANA